MSIALSLSDCLGPKKGTSILVRVAKLLRLSIERDLFIYRDKVTTKYQTLFKKNAYNLTKYTVHNVNVSVLIKFLQKDQYFYLNYHKFSIKSYVLDVY